MTCIHCGCTPQNACVVKVDDQPKDIRNGIRSHYKRAGMSVPRWIGCSWISTKPPVCSAPKCIAKQTEVPS